MNKLLQLTLGALLLLVLSACQQESVPAPASKSASSTAPVANIVAKVSPLLTIDPATMAACDPAVVADVKWDVRKSESSVSSVEVWVGSGSAAPQLFAAGGSHGDAKTGPWTRPGTHFVLKDKADGKLLGEAIVGGPTCH